MKELSKSGTCFLCGNIVPETSSSATVVDKEASRKWKEQCVVVLSGLLCASNIFRNRDRDLEDILIAAKYCSRCDVCVKDLCWSYQMMDSLRNRIAAAIKDIFNNITNHYEQLDNQSLTKRSSRSAKVLRNALRKVVDGSEFHTKSLEEIRGCIFYKLANVQLRSDAVVANSNKRVRKVRRVKQAVKVRKQILTDVTKIDHVDSKDFQVDRANEDHHKELEDDESCISSLRTGHFGFSTTECVTEALNDEENKCSVNGRPWSEEAAMEDKDFVMVIKDELSDRDQEDDDPTLNIKYFDEDLDEKQDNADFIPSETDSDDEAGEGSVTRVSKRQKSSNKEATAKGIDLDRNKSEDSDSKAQLVSQIMSPSGTQTTLIQKNKKDIELKAPKSLSKRKRRQLSRALRSFVCTFEECGFRFTNEVAREGHYQKIQMGNPRPFKCSICNKSFPFSTYLNYHLFKVHGQDNKQAQNYKSYECKLCSKSFQDTTSLELHMGSKHSKSPKIVRQSCKICGKGYDSKEEIDQHTERVHIGETPFKCEDCEEVFSNSVNLRNHTRMKHPPEGSVVCDLCQRVVLSEAHLTKHKQRNHPELFGKTIVCKFCKEPFQSQAARYYHRQKMHPETLKRTEWPCEICGVKCKTDNALRLHKRKHTGDKPYDCKVCGKSFRAIYDLKNHELAHSGVKVMCHYCGKTFLKNATFRNHLKMEQAKAENASSSARERTSKKRKETTSTLEEVNENPENPDQSVSKD